LFRPITKSTDGSNWLLDPWRLILSFTTWIRRWAISGRDRNASATISWIGSTASVGGTEMRSVGTMRASEIDGLATPFRLEGILENRFLL